MKKTYQLETLSCPMCASKIEAMLTKTNGVSKVEVLYMASKVKVEFDENIISNDDLKEKINRFGYFVVSEK